MPRLRTLLALAALSLTACATEENIFSDGGTDARTDARGDGPVTCTPGSTVCVNDVSRNCNSDGTPAATGTNCITLHQVCVDGMGCALCHPGATRCDPTDSQQVQVCAADGSGYGPGDTCDASMALSCMQGACVNRCDPANNTYLGCEYFPTVTANSALPQTFRFNVVVSNPNEYQVQLNITGGALHSPILRRLEPHTTSRVELPWVTALVQNNQGTTCGTSACVATSALVDMGGYHLTTNGPVAAYQFNPLEYRALDGTYSRSNDASLLLPVGALGTQYLVATVPNWTQPAAGMVPSGVRGGFVSIVPSSATTNTEVTVHLTASVSAGTGVTAGSGVQTYSLAPGQVLQLVSTGASGDLSGTLIETSLPVAVFAGHDCTQVPGDRPACDHLEEQLLPTTAWGKSYAVSPLRDRGDTEASLVRFTAQTDGVMLHFDGVTAPAGCMATMMRGQTCELQTASGFVVTSTLPFGVMQFMLSQGTISAQCNVTMPPNMPACVGDPAMVLEVPTEQYRLSYDFLIPMDDFTGSNAVYRYYANYVNVVAPTGAMITLDGMPVPGTQTPLGGGFGTWVVPVEPGPHHIETTNDAWRFGIKVYGVAPYTSYLYPGGLDIAPIAPPG